MANKHTIPECDLYCTSSTISTHINFHQNLVDRFIIHSLQFQRHLIAMTHDLLKVSKLNYLRLLIRKLLATEIEKIRSGSSLSNTSLCVQCRTDGVWTAAAAETFVSSREDINLFQGAAVGEDEDTKQKAWPTPQIISQMAIRAK